jgi:hypothetical protein
MNEQLAGLRPAHRDALRIAGAVMFAAGIFVLLIRKGDDWSDFPILLILLVPCVLFYGLGIGALRFGPDDDDHDGAVRADRTALGLPAWRATSLFLGIVFVPLVLLQLIELIGGDTDKPGWNFVVFLLAAGAAAYAAFVHGLRYGALLAGLFAIVAWLALCDAIFDPSATTVRWLFLVIGAALAAAAWRLHGDDRREAPELVTAAGIAGLAAGVTAFFAAAEVLFANAIASAFGSEGEEGGGGIEQHVEWDLFLLVLALVLIWYGVRMAWRGPVYVGGVALFAFIISAGTELADQISGDGPSGDVVGWPLLLLLLGAGALAAGLLGGRGPARPAAASPAPGTPATGTAPTQTLPPQPTDPPPPPSPGPGPGGPPAGP